MFIREKEMLILPYPIMKTKSWRILAMCENVL